jgi:hypothetical protein
MEEKQYGYGNKQNCIEDERGVLHLV